MIKTKTQNRFIPCANNEFKVNKYLLFHKYNMQYDISMISISL